MGFLDLFRKNTNDIGIDLGTVNTLVCTTTKGVVLREPSVVAIDYSQTPPQVIEVGLAARDMIGRTPGHIIAERPLRGGAITDFEITERMIRLRGLRPGPDIEVVFTGPRPGEKLDDTKRGRSGSRTNKQLSVENCPQKPESRGVGSRKKLESGMSSGLRPGSLMSTKASGLAT